MLKNLLALSQTLHFQQDMQRLQTILHEKQKNAQAFFSEHAASWGALQSIYYHNQPVEAALKKILHGQKFDFGVDLGTGTGYMLQFLAPYINKGLGIDLSKEMLFHARSALDKNSFSHLQVRYGDLTDLTLESASVDLVTLHLVLHYFDNPSLVLKEASRILKNNGTLIVVDFDCHTHEDLREKFKHRRLGFSEQDIEKITKKAALCVQEVINIDDTIQNSDLHVKIWRIAKV
jgi:ArsR family transcriptional regulator